MTPEDAKASHRAFIGEIGEDVFFIKSSGARVGARARVVGYQPREITGAVVVGDRRVICMVEDDLDAVLPIVAGADQVEIRGRQCEIKFVDDNTRRINGVLIALELQVTA
jgi:hypothetical protein